MRGLVVILGALALAPAAWGSPLLGVYGDSARFASQTGQRSDVGHIFLGWNQGLTWGSRLDQIVAKLGPVPMISITTLSWPATTETLTPLQISRGAGDAYLIALNAAVAGAGRRLVYIRPLAEMTGWWNPWCAFTRSGQAKGPAHSTAAFRKAFARMYLLLHGGTADELNRRLARLGLPGVHQDIPPLSKRQLRVIWGPQAHGDPQVVGNSPAAYYPGDAFVDVVGDDPYDLGSVDWDAVERLYRAHPSKGFAFPEWGLKGIDDPAFVQRMASFVRGHGRVEMLSFYNGKAGGPYDLAQKPRSRAAYRRLISPLAG